MSRLEHARSFRDLIVYQKARRVAKNVFELTKGFPKEEKYSLTDQVRRSSRSVGAQLAEAWAKRRYEKHFVSKLTDADGEQQETQHWVECAHDCGYLTQQQMNEILTHLSGIGRMLSSMMQKSSSFCAQDNTMVREDRAEYFLSSN
ncbi:MAG: four helix bundle protein [Kiritimatiellia bacterium]|jgi:four helix bundle protein|nr:four helix bundle protein [Kiritimatiellia bacterium]MDP6810877.1 four helix bundle protein [Kiritimatiellia bacterium]MDP7023404.1 four helix bundle protein [Kiritimatiellia bacterium]